MEKAFRSVRNKCSANIGMHVQIDRNSQHETLAEYYYRTNRHLLGKIKVAEFDPDKNILRIIQA